MEKWLNRALSEFPLQKSVSKVTNLNSAHCSQRIALQKGLALAKETKSTVAVGRDDLTAQGPQATHQSAVMYYLPLKSPQGQ